MEVPLQGSDLSEDEREINLAIVYRGVTVEWMFKEVKFFWAIMDYKRKLRIRQGPVVTLSISEMIVCNVRNLIYRN